MQFPNIYNNKRYKFYVIIPIAMLLIAIFFIPRIQLDQSLRGGISIQLQTNSIINTKQLTTVLDSQIPGAEATVTYSPGSVTVLVSSNQSIAASHPDLLSLYALNDSYTGQALLVGELTQELKSNGANGTVSAMLASARSNETTILANMKTALSGELTLLRPFTQNKSYGNPPPASAGAYLTAGLQAYNYSSNQYQNSILSILRQNAAFSTYSIQDVTPTLGAFFLQQLQNIILISFVVVALVVFLVFRNPIPSLTVVFGSANDILVALGAMALLGIPLGVASVGGLLMLIGYSMDTDILAAIRVLKRGEGTPQERAHDAMRTGITLTLAAIITFSILLVVSYLVYIPTYFEISSIVLVGLVADLVTTWLSNTVLLLWYKERKGAKSWA